MSRRKKKLHVRKERQHRSELRGEALRRARRLGEVTMFAWVCVDPNCPDGRLGR